MNIAPVDRTFMPTASGRIHYRHAGEEGKVNPPLVMLHGGPGSSAGLEPMIAALAQDRRVLAPDRSGCGDSDPPRWPDPEITDFMSDLHDFLSAIGLERIDLYGHHTGAQVAFEYAIVHPGRVRRLVLDGIALFPIEMREEFLTSYAPPVVPDRSGRHLVWVWDFASNLARYFPHYRHDDDHRVLPETMLPPEAVTTIAVEVLKNWRTFHLAYHAAFRHDASARLPAVQFPAFVLKTLGDPLAAYSDAAAMLLPQGTVVETSRSGKLEAHRKSLTLGEAAANMRNTDTR